MQKIVWHYFCRNSPSNIDKYIRYLLISVNSLITTAKVNPKDIFVSLDLCTNLEDSSCLNKIIEYGINIVQVPIYKNQSKCFNLYNVIKNNTDIDKIVQIDCDTIITDPNIIDKISRLEAPINNITMNWPITKVFDSRDGLKHPTYGAEKVLVGADHSKNLLFSICKNNQARYGSFKSFMDLVYNIDLDNTIEKLKLETRMFYGYVIVLCPKIIPESFFRFMAVMDLFFGDDEMIFTLAREYSGIQYEDINKYEKIVLGAQTVEDFNKYKGIIHFPVKDEEIVDDIENLIQKILSS